MATTEVTNKNPQHLKQESKLRRKVNDTIKQLVDIVAENELLEKLSVLDCLSWDEVVEERYLGKICGLPICANSVIHVQPHKYHIDRKNNKIYETCTERNKFCCEQCFNCSVAIRAQLDSQPLWITGENFKRMSRKYNIERPKKRLEIISDQKKSSGKLTLPSTRAGLSVKNIELVEDTLLANMNNLKIAERDGSSTEDEEEYFEHNNEKEFWASDDEIALKKKKEDTEFIESVRRFVTSSGPSCSVGEKAKCDSEKVNPAPHKLTIVGLSPTENQKLARIREKYSKKSAQRAPMLIDPPALSIRKVRETNAAETIDDGEKIAILKGKESVPLVVDPVMTIAPCSQADVIFVINTTKQWWTAKSLSLFKSGGIRPSNDMNKLMRRFLAGEKNDDIELEDVQLPELDFVNVEKRRLQILRQSLKPSWLLMESKLHVRSSQLNVLSSLLATFRLNADNIAGFERQQVRLLTAVIWRIVCHFTAELDEAFFPGGYYSKEICDYLEFCGIEEHNFTGIIDEVFKLFS